MSGLSCSLQIPVACKQAHMYEFEGHFGRVHFLALLFWPALRARAAKIFFFAG